MIRNRAASGQAEAKATRMREAVSMTRAATLRSLRRRVANSAVASAVTLGMACWIPSGLNFVPTPETHGAAALSRVARLAAINSALEVDLFGQANLEWRNGELVSGVGGAPDFFAGARLSPGRTVDRCTALHCQGQIADSSAN